MSNGLNQIAFSIQILTFIDESMDLICQSVNLRIKQSFDNLNGFLKSTVVLHESIYLWVESDLAK